MRVCENCCDSLYVLFMYGNSSSDFSELRCVLHINVPRSNSGHLLMLVLLLMLFTARMSFLLAACALGVPLPPEISKAMLSPIVKTNYILVQIESLHKFILKLVIF